MEATHQIMLVPYPVFWGANCRELKENLDMDAFDNTIGGVHSLPFFPFSHGNRANKECQLRSPIQTRTVFNLLPANTACGIFVLVLTNGKERIILQKIENVILIEGSMPTRLQEAKPPAAR